MSKLLSQKREKEKKEIKTIFLDKHDAFVWQKTMNAETLIQIDKRETKMDWKPKDHTKCERVKDIVTKKSKNKICLMMSCTFGQFLTSPPSSVTHLCPRPYALLSQNVLPLSLLFVSPVF